MNNHATDSGTNETISSSPHFSRVESLASLCSWSLNLADDTVQWSGEVCEIFDWSPEQGQFDREAHRTFIHPQDEEEVTRCWDEVVNDEPFDIEYRIRVNGTEKWVHERAEISATTDGDATVVTGVLQEITARKKRERELELFRSLVDRSSDGFYVIDRETGELLDVNETACEMLGYSRDELLSLAVPDINPDFSREMWDEFIQTVPREGSKTVEGKHRRKDSTTFPVEIQISYVSLEKEYHVATVRDITDRKERERELEATRKRYQTLINGAPDPIFVANAESGEILEANRAAAELRGQPLDEIIGLHQTELHPEAEADRYRDLFERHVRKDATIRQFEDGSPVTLMTADGERIPVSISTATVSVGDQTVIHGIFRDISDQLRYESSLKGVNRGTQHLLHAETDAEITSTVVEALTETVNTTAAAMYLYDDQTGELVPAAYSEQREPMSGNLPRFAAGDGSVWQVFTSQEPAQFENIRTSSDVFSTEMGVRSERIVPVGDHGVFVVSNTTVDAFDEFTDEITETIATTAETALDRAKQSQKLREQKRELQTQAQRLRRVHQLNEKIRIIMQALVETDSQDSMKQQVCEALVSLDQFECVWIGEVNLTRNEITVSAKAGEPHQYLEGVSLELAEANSLPAVEAVKSRATFNESNIAASPHQEEWRQRALLYDYRSVCSIPLIHNDILYGVLSIYSSQPESFGERTTTVLTELGELVGYALNAVDQRNALLQGSAETIRFEYGEGGDALVELARSLSSEIHVENITARTGETYLIHFVVEDADPDRVCTATEELPHFETIRQLTEDGPTRYEAVLICDCVATTLTNLGIKIQSVAVSEDNCQLAVSLPDTRDKQTCINHLKEQYPAIELIAQQERSPRSSNAWDRLLDESLTERQRDILTTAYYSGFFDQPRKRTGGEIADSLGISQPAFSKQLRVAQSHLLRSILGAN